MDTNRDLEKDQALNGTLRRWVVNEPLPPRFQEQVWQRIARAEAEPQHLRGFWARLLEVVLPRPSVAFAYVAVLLALGIAAGSLAAQMKTNRLETVLSARYVQSIDPYRAEHSN